MSERILKYTLTTKPEQTLRMPEGATILHTAVQRGAPCIWARAQTGAQLKPRRFALTVTGKDYDQGGRYVGTFLLHEGDFVAHLFELPAT